MPDSNYIPFENTEATAKEIVDIFTSDWTPAPLSVSSKFSISAPSVSFDNVTFDPAIESFEQSIGYFSDVFSDTEGYVKAADAVGSASLDFLKEKIDRIKTLWKTPDVITVKSLLGEVAPYAASLSQGKGFDALQALLSRLDELTAFLVGESSEGTWKSLGESLGESFLTELTTDPEVQGTLANLSLVKGVVSTLNGVVGTIDGISSVMKALEPIMPILEVTASLALALWSGGTSLAEASQVLAEELQKSLQSLANWSLNTLKKFLYNIEIEVPALFTGALGSLSIRDEFKISTNKDDENYKEMLQFWFDEGYQLQTIERNTLKNAIKKANNSLNTAKNIAINPSLLLSSEETKNNYLSNLTANFMTDIVKKSREAIKADSVSKQLLNRNYSDNLEDFLNIFEDSSNIGLGNSSITYIYDDETLRRTSKSIYDIMIG